MKVGYGRLSSLEQARDSHALEQQRARLEAAGCERIYVDVQSGKKDSRPELKRALASLTPADTLVATRLDRLTRSPSFNEKLLTKFSQDGAPGLLLLDDGLDVTTVTGRLTARLMAAVAAGEVERLSERVAHGRAHRQSKGGHSGKPPWGFRRAPNGLGLEIDPALQKVCLAAVRHFIHGRCMRATSAWLLEAHGITKNRTALRRWLQNPALAGGIGRCKGRMVVDPVTGESVRRPPDAGQYDSIVWDQHKGLISRGEWHEIERALATNAERGGGNRGTHVVTWANRRLYCSCGGAMHRHARQYRCTKSSCPDRFGGNSIHRELARASMLRAIEWMHGELSLQLAPLLARAESPASDPPEVLVLLDEIKVLGQVKGAESLIHLKEREIQAVRTRSQGQVLTQADALARLLPLWSQPWQLTDTELLEICTDAELVSQVRDGWVVEVKSERFGCCWQFDPERRREKFTLDTEILPATNQRLGLEQSTALHRTAAWWGAIDDERDRRGLPQGESNPGAPAGQTR